MHSIRDWRTEVDHPNHPWRFQRNQSHKLNLFPRATPGVSRATSELPHKAFPRVLPDAPPNGFSQMHLPRCSFLDVFQMFPSRCLLPDAPSLLPDVFSQMHFPASQPTASSQPAPGQPASSRSACGQLLAVPRPTPGQLPAFKFPYDMRSLKIPLSDPLRFP